MLNRRGAKTDPRRKADVVGMQKVRYKNHGTRSVKEGKASYKLFWSSNSTTQDGVEMMISSDLAKK